MAIKTWLIQIINTIKMEGFRYAIAAGLLHQIYWISPKLDMRLDEYLSQISDGMDRYEMAEQSVKTLTIERDKFMRVLNRYAQFPQYGVIARQVLK